MRIHDLIKVSPFPSDRHSYYGRLLLKQILSHSEISLCGANNGSLPLPAGRNCPYRDNWMAPHNHSMVCSGACHGILPAFPPAAACKTADSCCKEHQHQHSGNNYFFQINTFAFFYFHKMFCSCRTSFMTRVSLSIQGILSSAFTASFLRMISSSGSHFAL